MDAVDWLLIISLLMLGMNNIATRDSVGHEVVPLTHSGLITDLMFS